MSHFHCIECIEPWEERQHLLVLSVNNIVEPNNVLMLQFFQSEQNNSLTDARQKNSVNITDIKIRIAFTFQWYLFETYKLISRIAVLGIPSSSASRRIFLSAMISPVTLSLALQTTPQVPELKTKKGEKREWEFWCQKIKGGGLCHVIQHTFAYLFHLLIAFHY